MQRYIKQNNDVALCAPGMVLSVLLEFSSLLANESSSKSCSRGDHTVKIIDCETGSCVKVLGGHRRMPWVLDASSQ
ncbi:hypothetical protein Ahy_B01g055583 isoform C [Arachis hypogaea]|uniref:Uncharacterized protein n=1 Tax=Arachis hypogaea TaxID=3818 RepID=A0A445AWP7_ARAHY|nr:hypothetical protein Ahy_B01g055583 isoform C [Arachis hypogaea]